LPDLNHCVPRVVYGLLYKPVLGEEVTMKFSIGQHESSEHRLIVAFLLSFFFTPTVAAQAGSPASADPESFPWLIIPILLVFLAAVFFWFGRWIYGRKGCAIGAVRNRTFVGVVFPPASINPAKDGQDGDALKALRVFPWITFDVPVSVLGPGVTAVTEKKVMLNRVRGQIKIATTAIENDQNMNQGVDVVAKLSCEIGTPSVLSGNYWKKQTRLIRLFPENTDESHAGESGQGSWNQALVQDPAWLSQKLPHIVETALNLCGQDETERRV